MKITKFLLSAIMGVVFCTGLLAAPPVMAQSTTIAGAPQPPATVQPDVMEQDGLRIVTADGVRFQALNPARGAASPRSGVLWGDIRQDVATGTLVTFIDGFQSPPHIHNITYRGVVIQGQVHNDDPDAAYMWMGPGSFWTQPAGETHITAASGGDTIIMLEIMSGPYLVRPSDEAFDNGERPVNITADNIIWLDVADVAWMRGSDAATSGVEVAFLWGQPEQETRNGTFLRLPAGFEGQVETPEAVFRAVTIQGSVDVAGNRDADALTVAAGGYFETETAATPMITCTSTDACLIYVSTAGQYGFR